MPWWNVYGSLHCLLYLHSFSLTLNMVCLCLLQKIRKGLMKPILLTKWPRPLNAANYLQFTSASSVGLNSEPQQNQGKPEKRGIRPTWIVQSERKGSALTKPNLAQNKCITNQKIKIKKLQGKQHDEKQNERKSTLPLKCRDWKDRTQNNSQPTIVWIHRIEW